MKNMLLVLILLTYSLLLSWQVYPQSSQNKLPSIYIPSIIGNSIDKTTIFKIQSLININTLTVSKNRYIIIDEDMGNQLKKSLAEKQKMGCDETTCMQMIADYLEPNYILSSNLTKSDDKVILALKLSIYDKLNSSFQLENQVTVTFFPSQMDFYVSEGVKSLFNKSYIIDDLKAPPILSNSIEFKEFSSKELSMDEVQKLNSNEKDVKIRQILNILSDYEKDARKAMKDKDYKKAVEDYKLILNAINNKIREEDKKKIKDYSDSLNNNLKIAYNYYFQEQIQSKDEELKKENTEDPKVIEKYKNDYQTMQKEYKENEKEVGNPHIGNSLEERVTRLDLASKKIEEKEADELFNQYKFKESYDKYKRIYNSTKESNKEYTNYKKNIDKKIKIAKDTGTYNLMNKVRGYCDYAENASLKASLIEDSKKKNDDESKKLYKESENAMDHAQKEIDSNSNFSNSEIINYYNTTYETINKNSKNKIGKTIKSESEQQKERIQYYKIIDYIVPGLGEGMYGNKMGYWKAGAFLFCFLLSYDSYNQYSNLKTEYAKANDRWALLAIANLSMTTEITAFADNNLESIKKSAEGQSSVFDLFFIATLGIYYYNAVIPKQYDLSYKKTGFHWKFRNEYNPYYPTSHSGKAYNLQYTLEF